jgi:hypothetical protein
MKKRKNSPPIRIHTPKESHSGITTSTTKSESFYNQFRYELRHIYGEESKTCWFYDRVHMGTYINRYKVNPDSYTIVDRSSTAS